MQKTKLGVSVGLMGAAIILACLFSGYTAAILLLGYVLLCEENMWLKKTGVKAVVLMFGFSLLSAVVGFIPNAFSLLNSLLGIFHASFHLSFVSSIVSVINDALTILEKVLFILMGLKALSQGSLKLPVIDSLVDKYMD